MIVGTLIAESLRVGSVLDGMALQVTKVARADVGAVDAGQPRAWTFVEFTAADDQCERLADALSRALDDKGGWYCDFRTDDETFVVFARRVFRYARGDRAGRDEAVDYGRTSGVPEEQIDWPE